MCRVRRLIEAPLILLLLLITPSDIYHYASTCSMKPRAQGGGVDERLNIFGVKKLKVADMSIIPENVGANTFGTVSQRSRSCLRRKLTSISLLHQGCNDWRASSHNNKR